MAAIAQLRNYLASIGRGWISDEQRPEVEKLLSMLGSLGSFGLRRDGRL
jgi:hypothetical protein